MAVPYDRNDVKNTPTSTEDSAERGWVNQRNDEPEPSTYRNLGESDELESEGDIADEGRGHRG